MAWDLPSTPTAGTTVATVTNWATPTINCLRYLYGSDGEIVLVDYPDFPSTAQGDVFYHNGTKLARLAASTSGYFLQTKGAAANPVWANGGVALVVRKSADETVNNSDTLQNDDHLLFSIAANEVWLVELFLLCNDVSGGDYKFGWSYPTSCTMYWGARTQAPTNTTDAPSFEVNEAGGAAAVALAIQTGTLIYDSIGGAGVSGVGLTALIVNGANAGTINFQWAQGAAFASDTKLLTNSCMLGWKIA